MASLLHTSRSVTRRVGIAVGAILAIVLLCDCARPDDGLACCLDDYVQHPQAEELWQDWSDPGDRFWSEPPGPLAVTIDYRALTMFGSRTSYQFGTPPQLGGPQYAPMSKLVFPLNSCWNGFRLGVEKADSAAHFEWLTPMGPRINGDMEDFDWNINEPRDDPTRLDSLSRSLGQWNEGQMLNIEYEFRVLERLFGVPVEVWPTFGYRWQRFRITDFNGVQVIPPDGPFPPPFDGALIAFRQEYSIGYIGAQLRGKWESGILPPIALTLQGDWGYTQA